VSPGRSAWAPHRPSGATLRDCGTFVSYCGPAAWSTGPRKPLGCHVPGSVHGVPIQWLETALLLSLLPQKGSVKPTGRRAACMPLVCLCFSGMHACVAQVRVLRNGPPLRRDRLTPAVCCCLQASKQCAATQAVNARVQLSKDLPRELSGGLLTVRAYMMRQLC
jgi:hypothetical protein